MVDQEGIEPSASSMRMRRSTDELLAQITQIITQNPPEFEIGGLRWWAWKDSNLRPRHYQ